MLTKDEIKLVQGALNIQGFSAGNVDGIIGRRTITAVRNFQIAKGLSVDGIIGPQTLGALGLATDTWQINSTLVPWMAIARNKIGFLESQKRTADFLKSDGATLGNPAKLPWCGDFVETCLALALPQEVFPSNPYWALNWLKFGQVTPEPFYGSVAVFHRSGGGHVGFVVGHDSFYVHVLGGNQSNSVSIAKLAKTRLQGYRWPNTQPLPTGDPLPYSTLSASISRNEA